jgi:hypothetical protein
MAAGQCKSKGAGMKIPSVRVLLAWSPLAMAALVLVASGAAGCGGDSEPAESTLAEQVREAMAQADYRLQMTGPFGDGAVMSIEVEHVAPDRWRIRQQGDCEADPDEQIMIGPTTYWRRCDEEEWRFAELGPEEALAMTEIFDWPSIYLSAVREPRTVVETEPEGTEVIVLTGEVDCEALLEVLAQEGYQTSGSECTPDISITMNARIRAEDFSLVQADWSWGEERIIYRYSDLGEVPPIVAPSPVALAPTPRAGPLPTPAVPPATPHVAP